MQDSHAPPTETAGRTARIPLPPQRQRTLLAATLALMALVVLASASFLWFERERILDETSALAARGANRLATDLQQSLTVARTAIDQFNEPLQQASAQPFQTPAVGMARSQAQLLAALPLPFRLHAIGPQDQEIPLISDKE